MSGPCSAGAGPLCLRAACGNDSSLEKRVRQLLEAHCLADDVSLSDLLPKPDVELRPIGPYLPVKVLGEGGWRLIFLRSRTAIAGPPQGSPQAGSGGPGFETDLGAVRSGTAGIGHGVHPNIAKVLDAGEAPDGRPFFVMELVEGIPITRYCDQSRLSVRERLRAS